MAITKNSDLLKSVAIISVFIFRGLRLRVEWSGLRIFLPFSSILDTVYPVQYQEYPSLYHSGGFGIRVHNGKSEES
ncbi:hypothetical protein RIR_jg5614.t1 [Rhizophagus irregularis DAOM 181602=DAOM 197198]|nr:hypothetical protein RIR_jg5614.t1 [Rhizophagus irregularis DAOM 181602=DAOM 197198]